jgi:phosphorylated CTD-interacting factor 1
MYRRALGNGNNRHGEHERDDAVVDELLRREFPRLLFSLLLRYDALEGAGLQSAVPDAVFRYLRTRFGLGVFECFASPLNCYWSERGGSSDDDDDTGSGEGAVVWGGGRYGSAFIDTDAPFGSAGSFFDLDFSKGGVYQANPPFASEFIEKMYSRMHHSLATTEIPLMFVVFVPSWSESPGYRMIETSLHVTRHVLLSQKDDVHYYTEGTQHRRRSSNDDGGGHRTASFDTSVFFLQNDAARERWPLRDDDGIILKSAFSMNPIDSEGIREGGKDGIRGKKISRDRTVKTPSVVSRRRDGSGNAASLSAKRGRRETKKAKSERKSNVSLMKTKKLMTGGQDELSILASMGILDGEQHQR